MVISMATEQRTIDILFDLLAGLPVSARKMFGEYAIYLDGKTVAFVTDDVFSLKVTSLEDARLTNDLLGEAYPGSKMYWRIPMDMLEDREWAERIVSETAELIPQPKPKTR